MKTHNTDNSILTAETEPCVRRVLTVLDDYISGKDVTHTHPHWHDSVQENIDDAVACASCANCGKIYNQFYTHVVPLDLPVIFQFKFASPISFLTFLVVRRAKLSLYRLKHRQFNEDELHRIADAVSELASVKFKIYDCRRVSGDLNLDGGESVVLFSL